MYTILDLPYRTHCSLLNFICDDIPIEYQMCCHFVNFFKSLVKSDNTLTQLCSKLVLSGSRSAICNSLTHVSALLKYNRNDIVYYNTSKHDFKHKCDAVTSSVIRDVLHMKYQNYYDRSQSFLD